MGPRSRESGQSDETAPESEHGGWGLVVREGVDPFRPVEIGDVVTTYELSKPWPYGALAPHSSHPIELEEYQQAVMELSGQRDEHWLVLEEVYCDCKQRRAVAQLLMHLPSERRWASAKGERIPSAFTKESDNGGGWVLHGRPGEVPHVGHVSTCKGCRRNWLIVSFVDSIEALEVSIRGHGPIVE